MTKPTGRRTKSLPTTQNDAARVYVKKVIAGRFGGVVQHAADAFGVSQSMLYEFSEGKRGAGMKLLAGVSAVTGDPIEIILGTTPPERTVEREDESTLDPKEKVRRTALYREAPAAVQHAFDVGDAFTRNAKAAAKDVKYYTGRLLNLIAQHDAGDLADPDELLPGAELEPISTRR